MQQSLKWLMVIGCALFAARCPAGSAADVEVRPFAPSPPPDAVSEPVDLPFHSIQPRISGRVDALGATPTLRPGVVPLGPSLGAMAVQRRVAFPPLPASRPQASERRQGATLKGRLQIGQGRALDQALVVNATTAPPEQWTTLASGWRILSIEVQSPGAAGLRVHLESLRLPDGVQLLVYDPANPNPQATPITTPGAAGVDEFWAETVLAERVIVECQASAKADLPAASFTISGVSHLYEFPAAQVLANPSACENDVSCYPGWAAAASGVARILFVDQGNTYLCSGCLLNANTSSPLDYFLTANHCIDNQTIASTVEVYWFYQTSVCNGPAPSWPSGATRTTGSEFLAGSSLSDFTLLKLTQAPPENAYYLGWTTSLPARGEAMACIHHPGQPPGDYKRISFGQAASSSSKFWMIQWNSGVTEDGSSGSPLLNSSHQVLGQLYGGSSSCAEPTGLDQFGRFDQTYAAIKRWIDPNAGGAALLTITTTGPGAVSPNYNGRMLVIGKEYRVTAIPKSGYVFGGWSGGFVTNTPLLPFFMKSNLVLQANFVTNPFFPFKGVYRGLFQAGSGVALASSGAITLTTTAQGAFSGSLRMAEGSHSFSGRFDPNTGAASAIVARSHSSLLSVQLRLDLTQGSDRITGWITNAMWSATLAADRGVFDGRNRVAPQAGLFTLVLPGDFNSPTNPPGDSYGLVKVGGNGDLHLTGVLADGTRISQSSAVSKAGLWPLFAPLNSGLGALLSWVGFTNATGYDLTGVCVWTKANQPAAKRYPGPFTVFTNLFGSVYTAPKNGRILNLTNASAAFNSLSLPRNFTNTLRLGANNRVTNSSANRLNLSFAAASGALNGRVVDPNTSASFPFNGVVLQKQRQARGFFLTSAASGQVLLQSDSR